MDAKDTPNNAAGGLCHRCEERALFLEEAADGHPRAECGQPAVSKHACYCYRPVRPILLVPAEGDDCPVEAGTIQCARTRRAGLMQGEILSTWQEDGLAMWWKADPYRSKDAHLPTKQRIDFEDGTSRWITQGDVDRIGTLTDGCVIVEERDAGSDDEWKIVAAAGSREEAMESVAEMYAEEGDGGHEKETRTGKVTTP
jgi:hypothetical protein